MSWGRRIKISPLPIISLNPLSCDDFFVSSRRPHICLSVHTQDNRGRRTIPKNLQCTNLEWEEGEEEVDVVTKKEATKEEGSPEGVFRDAGLAKGEQQGGDGEKGEERYGMDGEG